MKRQALLKAPPKQVFQFLCDPTLLEEISGWKVDAPQGFDVGTAWTERRLLAKRSWTVTSFDRRGLSYTLEGPVTLHILCKKGGPGSCNVQMHAEGEARALARFARSDGDRLARIATWMG